MISDRDLLLGTFLYNYSCRILNATETSKKFDYMLTAAFEHKSFHAINVLLVQITHEIQKTMHVPNTMYNQMIHLLNNFIKLTQKYHGTPGFILSSKCQKVKGLLISKTCVNITSVNITSVKAKAYEQSVVDVCVARKIKKYSRAAIEYAYADKGSSVFDCYGRNNLDDLVSDVYNQYKDLNCKQTLSIAYFEQIASEIV
eukprot:356767_1